MTRPEFLLALAKTPRTWRLRSPFVGAMEMRAVIRNKDSQCPIEAVFGWKPLSVHLTSRPKELEPELFSSIMRVADDRHGRDEAPFREEVREACGL